MSFICFHLFLTEAIRAAGRSKGKVDSFLQSSSPGALNTEYYFDKDEIHTGYCRAHGSSEKLANNMAQSLR